MLARALAERLRTRSRVRLAIPGGSALGAAVSAARRLGADWGRVQLTWVDERRVPFADVESNRGAAARLGLLGPDEAGLEGGGDGPRPAEILPLFEDGETATEAVARVESALERAFDRRLDVVLLGMGADGHVASLFPSRPMPKDGLVAALDDSPKPPAERITLTREALETAQATILVATGEGKRDAITRLVGGDEDLPAHGLPRLQVATDLDHDFEHEGASVPDLRDWAH